MSWHLTTVLIHLAALGGIAVIWLHAPGLLQRIFLLIAASGFAWVAVGHAMILGGAEVPREFIALGYMAGHFACLLSVLRICIVDQERRCPFPA